MFTLHDYMTNLYLQHRQEIPHISSIDVQDCIEEFEQYLFGFSMRTPKDMRKIRSDLMVGYEHYSLAQKQLLDLCFPSTLGPFSRQVFNSMLPPETENKTKMDYPKWDLKIDRGARASPAAE
ncbi:hypothetical protein HDV01_007902 [Terramyces sp. JEL0728]|nr:hypothetical protein HDV01_007902 [Terramyces sp. JEL0728]